MRGGTPELLEAKARELGLSPLARGNRCKAVFEH